MSMITVYGFNAALLAVTAEYLYTTMPGTWLSNVWVWMPIQMAISYLLYNMIQLPVSLLEVFVAWAVATQVLRVFVSAVLLQQHVGAGMWVATAMMLAAKGISVWWR